MGVFFVLLLVPMMMQHIAIKGYHIDYEKRSRFAMAFFFCGFTALVMLRHESIGNDTRNYIHFFEKYSRMEWSRVGVGEVEKGFAYFNKLVSVISKEPHFFLAATAAVTSIMIYPTYKRLCTDASLTIVLFCTISTFVLMFSGIRQMLAIGIGFIAYDYTRNKKLFRFVITVVVAMSFHTSAFMLAFMYPMYHARITKKWLLVVVPVLAVMFLLNQQIFSVLAAIMERFTKYEGDMASTGAYTMLILFAMFTVFAFLIPQDSLLDSETIGLRNFLLLVLGLQMFAPLHELAMRMNYYYIIFVPLLLPKIIQHRSKRWNQVAVAGRHVMVAFFLVYFFMDAYRGGSLHVFPYHFFWETIG